MTALLRVRDLEVQYRAPDGPLVIHSDHRVTTRRVEPAAIG